MQFPWDKLVLLLRPLRKVTYEYFDKKREMQRKTDICIFFYFFFYEFLLYYKHKSISNISNAQKKELQKPNLLIIAGVLTYLHCEANLKGVHCLFPKIHVHIWTPSLSHEALILTWQI